MANKTTCYGVEYTYEKGPSVTDGPFLDRRGVRHCLSSAADLNPQPFASRHSSTSRIIQVRNEGGRLEPNEN